MIATSNFVDPYLQDASGYQGSAQGVSLPANLEELQRLVACAATENVPLTVAGARTGLTGACVPHTGLIVSLEKFRKLEIEAGRARCGAGVLLSELHKAATQGRQFFGPNPTESSASIGGIINTNAGGARSFRYRSVRHHVLALEVTFMDGRTRRFKQGETVDFPFQTVQVPATTKNAAGYLLRPGLTWVDLISGSEGTLGIVTEADLRLLPEPEALLSGVIFFGSDDAAMDAVEEWRSVPELRLVEFMDEHALCLLRPRYEDIPKGARAALLIEQNLLSEDDVQIDLWSDRLTKQNGFDDSWFGFRHSDHERFRAFRHALPAMVTDTVRRNGFSKFGTDFAVPIERHRELYNYYKRRCYEVLPGQFTIFGHAGDANNHVNLLPATPRQADSGEKLIEEFASVVLSMGGTVAAEHGIGKIKTDLLRMMLSERELGAMREVKEHLDPRWLLGQETIFGNHPTKAKEF